jgi:hypothetical protein
MANKPLVLVVDAQIDGLSKSLRDGKTVLADFGRSAQDMLADLRDRMGSGGGAAGAEMASQMSRNLTQQMQNMRRSAEAAVGQGKTFDPLGGMDSASALKAAASYEKMAMAMRARADASARVVGAGEQESLVLKQLAVASAVSAEEFARMAQAMRVQAGVFGAVESEMAGAADASSDRVVAGHNRVGVSSQMMMHSVRSAADSFAAGLPPAMIFAEQISRVSEAMVYAAQESGATEGAMAKFAGFMTSGWGIAVIAGVSVLGTMISHMDLFKEKAVENAKALDDLKAGDNGLSDAQKALGDMFDMTTGKLQHQNEMLRLNARLAAMKLRADADADDETVKKTFGTVTGSQGGLSFSTIALGAIANALPGGIGGVGDEMNRANVLRTKIQGVQAGTIKPEDVQKWSESFNFDGLGIDRAKFNQALIARAEASQKRASAAATDSSLDSGVLDPSLRKETKEKRPRKPPVDKTPANDDAYDQLWDRLTSDATGLGRQNDTSIEQKAQTDRNKVAAALRKQMDQISAQGREHQWSPKDIEDAQTFAKLNAGGQTSEITAKEKRDIADRDLAGQQKALEQQDTLLDLQEQLTTNLKDRRDIALKLLDNQKQAEILSVQRDVNSGKMTGNQGADKVAGINTKYDLRTQQTNQQMASPLDAYKQDLIKNVGDMNTALQGIEVSGIQSLEDNFAGLVTQSENAEQAVKSMVTSAVSQLAKLAAQKIALSIFGLSTGGTLQGRASGGLLGFATGGLPGFAGGTRSASGMISGPGTGTSDSILAMINGKDPILVSNDEGIVNAQAVRNYWPAINAMNKGTYPRFSTGGAIGGLAYPALPSANSVRGANGTVLAPIQFDLRGAITTPQLMQQMVAISQQHSTAVLAAAPGLAQQQMNDTAAQRIPT